MRGMLRDEWPTSVTFHANLQPTGIRNLLLFPYRFRHLTHLAASPGPLALPPGAGAAATTSAATGSSSAATGSSSCWFGFSDIGASCAGATAAAIAVAAPPAAALSPASAVPVATAASMVAFIERGEMRRMADGRLAGSRWPAGSHRLAGGNRHKDDED